jgi:hypothetical protein
MSVGAQVDFAELTEIRARRPEAIDDKWPPSSYMEVRQ